MYVKAKKKWFKSSRNGARPLAVQRVPKLRANRCALPHSAISVALWKLSRSFDFVIWCHTSGSFLYLSISVTFFSFYVKNSGCRQLPKLHGLHCLLGCLGVSISPVSRARRPLGDLCHLLF